jgi:hypothetical protein
MARHRSALHACAAVASTAVLVTIAPACVDDPPYPPGTSQPVAAADVDRSCARIASCQPPGSPDVAECVETTMTRPASGLRLDPALVACLDAAGAACDDVAACLPGSAGDLCEGRGNDTFCSGNLLVRCFAQSVEAVTDCRAWGLACAESDAFEPTCLGEGPSCIRGSQRCDGRDAVLCVGFRDVSFDCADLVTGRTCTEEAGNVRCGLPEPACDPRADTANCDGSRLAFCSAAGVETSLDCAALGFARCDDSSGRAVCAD